MSPGANATWITPPPNFEVGLGQFVEGIIRHPVASQEFRLRVARERRHRAEPCQQHGAEQREPTTDLVDASSAPRLGAGLAIDLRKKIRHLFDEIIDHRREQDLALGRASPGSDRHSCRNGCNWARRRRMASDSPGVSYFRPGLASARDISTRSGASASISDVSSSSAWLPWPCSASLCGGAAIARSVVDPQVQHVAGIAVAPARDRPAPCVLMPVSSTNKARQPKPTIPVAISWIMASNTAADRPLLPAYSAKAG